MSAALYQYLAEPHSRHADGGEPQPEALLLAIARLRAEKEEALRMAGRVPRKPHKRAQ